MKKEEPDDETAPISAKKKGKQKISEFDEDSKGSMAPRPPPLVSVAAIVGGMSAQKQRRILSRGVDVLVATPGRLWDILQEVRSLTCSTEKYLCVHFQG